MNNNYYMLPHGMFDFIFEEDDYILPSGIFNFIEIDNYMLYNF